MAAPSVSTAAQGPTPPQACSKQEKYVTEYWWVKTEVCLTKDGAGKPIIRFWAECQEYTKNMVGIWAWHYTSCSVATPYALSKDGEDIDYKGYADTRWRSYPDARSQSYGYECRGHGLYTVTSDFETYGGAGREATQTFTVSAQGC
jgi:hypothetical protein